MVAATIGRSEHGGVPDRTRVRDDAQMDDPIAAYTSVETADEFWLRLGAVLTDEVVIVEAVASGMDWPDF
jgi:hypothetical protein